jgi:hypothetical protein
VNARWTQEMKYFSIFSDAARHINYATVLCKVTVSIVKWVRMCIKVDGSHSEHELN